jgi:L-threonylcarbamoyladenylate synthase
LNSQRDQSTSLPATGSAIQTAAKLLRDGKLVAFPTETVYGLGADATNGRAVASIFEAKGRPHFNPLIVHVATLEAACRVAEWTPLAQRLALAFWPGPLTLVLRKRADSGLSDLVSAGLDTVAVRIPDHPIAKALLEACQCPVAAPSANRSGHVSATTARHVLDDLGLKVAMVLDGGPTAHGIESTVIEASGAVPVLLRAGAVTVEQIEFVSDCTIIRETDSKDRPHAPGQLQSHYAPRARVRLNAVDVSDSEALLAFGDPVPRSSGAVINLSPNGDLIEAASTLFAALRGLDASGASSIAVMPIPDHGLGEAINDRLRRAAAPRE